MFRYYITSTMNGCIYGTNDKVEAEQCALSEDDFVIDTETNEWMMSDEKREQIKDVKEQMGDLSA